MKMSKDITLVIMFAVLTFVFRFLIGRFVGMVEGLIALPGFSYLLSIFFSIIHSVAFLMYGGRRWRLFSQAVLSTLLFLMFINPAFRAVEMATLLNMFIVDVVFNSFYGSFERKNKLLWLTLIFQAYYWATHSIWLLLFSVALFFPFEPFFNNWFVPTMSVMIPIMVAEGLIGGYIGYHIYLRVKKVQNL